MRLFQEPASESILDYRMTARVPFGIILQEMIALETRGLNRLPAAALSRATNIQIELVVIDIIRQDAAAGGPYRETIHPEKLAEVAALNLWQMIGPPGEALEAFRTRFLKNPDLDVSHLVDRATQLQATNHVPPTVPPMGSIYVSPLTGLGRHGGAIIDHYALNAALLIQAACRALIEPSERYGLSIAKTFDTDPVPLRKSQELANRLLVERRFRTPGEITEIHELLQIAVGWLLDAGFAVYAGTVVAFLNEPRGPLARHRLETAGNHARAGRS